MNIIKDLLLVGAGGFLGAAARYGVYLFFAARAMNNFPLATLTVNAAGSFLIGLLGAILPANCVWRLFFVVGILGGFTTFSTFSHETMVLLNNGRYLHAFLNILLNVILCLIFVFAGFKIGSL
ncbi:MAG: fluoride efflux transporter CrcB [Elusimicrobiota bacterium]|jgi:CrcB protein|nr:fluoride efflux transporter CrcB [Elusimicrobiota bacterium]